MDPSANPSPTSAPFSGQKRHGTSSQPLPPPQHAPQPQQQHGMLSNKDLRDKIVEVLSNTANGCLTELGYYPGMTSKLKQLEAKNKKWEDENVKLYEDNGRLMATVRDLQAKLKLVTVPEAEKIARIRELEQEVQVLRTSASGANNQQAYDALQTEYNNLKGTYRMAYAEVQRLTQMLQRAQALPAPPPHGPLPSQAPQYYVATHGSQHHPPPIQTQFPQGVWHGGQPSQHVSSPMAMAITPTAQMQQGFPPQRNPLLQTQHAALQQRQGHVVVTSNPSSRRSSVGMPMGPPTYHPQSPHSQTSAQTATPPLPTQPIVPHHGTHVQQQHMQQPYAFHSTVRGPQDPLAIMAANVRHTRRASNPNTPIPSYSHMAAQPAPRRMSSQSVPSPAPRIGSAPIVLNTNTPLNVETQRTPASASSMHAPTSFSTPPIVPPNAPPLNPVPSMQNMAVSSPQNTAMANVSPQTAYLHSQTVQQPQPSAPIAPPYIDVSTPQYDQSLDTSTPQSFNGTPMLTTVSPRDLQGPPLSLKRESIAMSEGYVPENEPQKRPRLEGHDPQASGIDAIAIPQPHFLSDPSFSTGFGTTDTMLVQGSEVSQNSMQVDYTINPEEEDDYVEVGPDGLRLVHDCLAEFFQNDGQGGRTCKLCLMRYQHNHLSEPPTPFIEAPDEMLEAHCIAEHEVAWMEARRVED